MNTQFASEAHFQVLVNLGQEYFDHQANPATLLNFTQTHIRDPDKVCLVAGDPPLAAICGVIAPHYLTGQPTAFKTAWIAKPGAGGHGARLLHAFEGWAKDRGAERIIVSGRDPRTCKLLEHRNYTALETVFTKTLT